ncbi:hypothetical protein [Rhizobium rhizophilum]|uniref:Uncharacterized protein n=1 Tax=Rhizobium rhizophilum TaxID=1850373 RepID=A0ABY2QTZ5_9HYPH|nr:hypothetical protein [Rhizobium rhizophilum]THV13757.1 hypothetical protein E9677_12680 [Rhizobium rhizophilum]
MNQHTRRPEQDPPPRRLTDSEKGLVALAGDLVPLLPPAWTHFYNAEEQRREIYIEGDTGPMARPLAILTDDAGYADIEFLIRGAQMLHALVAAGRRQRWIIYQLEAEIRRLKGEPDPDAKKFSHVQQCGTYCGRADFQQWLRDIHGADIADANRIATHVRNMLRVKSRAELDENPEAAARWQSLLKSFKERAR